jgi:hypothetical protein
MGGNYNLLFSLRYTTTCLVIEPLAAFGLSLDKVTLQHHFWFPWKSKIIF